MTGDQLGGYLDPRDRAHVATLDGPDRELVASTVTRFRKEDRLEVGDPVPELALLRLEDGTAERLAALVGERPLVLFFGSFT